MLYSKNGSIPKPQTDGTDGWIEVPEPPFASEGLEVVWWYPPGWIVRPPMPVREGYRYSWSQSEGKWVEYEEALSEIEISDEPVITLGSAADTISMGSASDVIIGV